MATLNSRGQILHGIGGGVASIDNAAFSYGAAGGFVDDATAFFADALIGYVVSLYDLPSGEPRRAVADPADPRYNLDANAMFAGGGVWAAWRGSSDARRGVYTSTGLQWPEAGLLGVGPDGCIGYKPSYQSGGPTMAHERDGREWMISPGHAADLMLLGEGRAIWQEGGAICALGIPRAVQLGVAWKPQAFAVAGYWWIAYFCAERGVVLHPIDDASAGYVLSPPTVNCWHFGRTLADGRLRFALSSSEGEQPGQVRAVDVDWAQPLVDFAPTPVPPDPEPPEPTPVPPDPIPTPEPPEPTPVPPGPDPQPPTSEVLMLKAYSDEIIPGFRPGEEVDNGNGTISVKKPNGKFVCVTPEGRVEERDTAGGVWESFTKGRGCLIAERDGGDKGPLVYVLYAADAEATQ